MKLISQQIQFMAHSFQFIANKHSGINHKINGYFSQHRQNMLTTSVFH